MHRIDAPLTRLQPSLHAEEDRERTRRRRPAKLGAHLAWHRQSVGAAEVYIFGEGWTQRTATAPPDPATDAGGAWDVFTGTQC